MPFIPFFSPVHRMTVYSAGFRAGLYPLIAALLLLAFGCDSNSPPPTPPPAIPPAASQSAAPADNPASSEPALPQARRVVAFAPTLVEYVFAMGEKNRLVGASEYCDYPPEAKQIPVLGNAIQPDLERIIAAKPDLILGIGKSEKLLELAANSPANTLRVEALQIETLDQVIAAPEKIAALMGLPGRGKGLHDRLKGDIDAVTKICQKRTTTPRVLVFTGEGDALFTIGRGSFLTDLVEVCGGDCVTKNLAKPWPTIGLEDLAQANPDVILMLQSKEDKDVTAAEKQALVDRWKDYADFPAVKNHRVLVLTGSHLLKG
ncbi:MAG TPA: helical backbone metal receptor, partial [Planctomycetota bacterium]|nr:helical backbone metal receptor [Planctomycetota bacterium]